MTTLLARLKPYDPRRGHVLRRFTFAGIKFDELRGWYRVEPEVADYLRKVRQRPIDPHTPLAFDVCTDDEARAMDARDKEAANPRKTATDDIQLSPARVEGVATTPRRVITDDAPPPSARVEGAATTARRVVTDDVSPPARVEGAMAPPRRALPDDAAPPPARVEAAVTPPRRVATDDAAPPPVRSDRAVPTMGLQEPGKDDRKPAASGAEVSEVARDDRRPAPAPRKDRP